MIQSGLLRIHPFRKLALFCLQHAHQNGGNGKSGGRDQQQGVGADTVHEQSNESRGADGAHGTARRDESEQALGLAAREDVSHQAPKHRDGEKVETADPDVERGRDPAVIRNALEQKIEHHQGYGDEAIDPGQEARQPDARGKACEKRCHHEAQHKGAGKKLLQMLDAIDCAHGVAQGTQYEIAGHKKEEINKGDHDCLDFVWLNTCDIFQRPRKHDDPAPAFFFYRLRCLSL